uniref:BED-type domain-containing protein n=1 Tax=Rhabditophanes sp. KR3021 TaxID=114890 RepID=A0AC35U3L8_9BILA
MQSLQLLAGIPMAPVSDSSNRMRRKGGRDKRHWAWQFFKTGEPSENGGPPSAQCKLCDSIIKWAGSTNIGKHLRRRHKDIFQDEAIRGGIVTSPIEGMTSESMSMSTAITCQLTPSKTKEVASRNNNSTSSSLGHFVNTEVLRNFSGSESPTSTSNKPMNRNPTTTPLPHPTFGSGPFSSVFSNASVGNAANLNTLINSKRSGVSLSRRYLALYHAAYPLGNIESQFFKKFCSLVNTDLPDRRTLNIDAHNEMAALVEDAKNMLAIVSDVTISISVASFSGTIMCGYFAHFLHPAESKPSHLALRVISFAYVPSLDEVKSNLDAILHSYNIDENKIAYYIMNSGYQTNVHLQDLPLPTQAEQNRVLVEVITSLLRATTNGESLEEFSGNNNSMDDGESNNNYDHSTTAKRSPDLAFTLNPRFRYPVNIEKAQELFGKEKLILCAAHILYEIFEVTISKVDVIKSLKEKVLKIIAFLFESPGTVCALSKMGITNILFPYDGAWNSMLTVYNALNEFAAYNQINTVAQLKGWPILDGEEIIVMKEYVEMFSKLTEYMEMIRNGDSGTVSMLYPTLQAILNHMNKNKFEPFEDLCKDIHDKIRENFKDCLESGKGDIKNYIYITAAFLDRRSAWLLTEEEKKVAVTATIVMMQKQNANNPDKSDGEESDKEISVNDIAHSIIQKATACFTNINFESPFKDLANDRLNSSSTDSSLDSPEKDQVLSYTRELNPEPVGNEHCSTQFWKALKWKYPLITAFATSILYVPITSTIFEDILQEETNTGTGQRNSTYININEEIMNRRVLVSCNKWLISF